MGVFSCARVCALHTFGKIIKQDWTWKVLKLLELWSESWAEERKKVLLFSFWNLKSTLFCHICDLSLKSVNWHVRQLLTIFVIYKAFCKGTVFLSSLYVVNTGVGTWIFAVGMWKTLEAALCQVISPRICFTFWQSMTCQVWLCTIAMIWGQWDESKVCIPSRSQLSV